MTLLASIFTYRNALLSRKIQQNSNLLLRIRGQHQFFSSATSVTQQSKPLGVVNNVTSRNLSSGGGGDGDSNNDDNTAPNSSESSSSKSTTPLSDMLDKMRLQGRGGRGGIEGGEGRGRGGRGRGRGMMGRGGREGGRGGRGGRGRGRGPGRGRGRGRGDGLRQGRPIDPKAEWFRQSQLYQSHNRDGFRGPQATAPTLAVSLLHGDYSQLEYEKPEYQQGYSGDNDQTVHHGPGTGNPYSLSEGEIDEDEQAEEEKNIMAEVGRNILEMEEKMKKDGERKAALRRPVERFQTLDEKGRAFGRGGRKTSTASVWIFKGEGNITVNKRDLQDYFVRETHRETIISPFVATKSCGMFDVVCQVHGGGLSGQAGAIRHGLSRALQNYYPNFRMPLKVLGFLTRDARRVEPKKPGRPKARKKRQWVKR